VSLWRIVPSTANPPQDHAESHSKGQQRDCDRDRDRDRERIRDRVRERERSMSLEESKEIGFINEDDEDDEGDEDLDNDDDIDNDNDKFNNENEENASSITVGPELQCFLNVNCLTRQPYASTHNSYTGTENRNKEENDDGEDGEKVVEKEERVVTLQFLPNSELLLVGTNKRLLLIVVGAANATTTVQCPGLDSGPNTGICGDVWNVSIDPLRDSNYTAFSLQAREQSLSHWLSQSPTPYKRQYMNMIMNTNASKDNEVTFISWIELDQVPPYCEGIFSMSVGPEGGHGVSEHGSGSGSGSEQGQGQGQGQGQDEEMSIFLWKVIVQSEVPELDRDVSGSTSDMLEAALTPAQLDAHTADKPMPSTAKPDKNQGGTLFSFFSSSPAPAPVQSATASNSVPVSTTPPTPVPVPAPITALVPAPAPMSVPAPVLVPVPASPDTVTPKKPALNLNLKEEKETPFMNNDSKNSRTTARSNFDVDVDDLSDCRVYRLKWTAEMFRTAFKNSKAIPQHALEDHLSKIF
jgi:hypothetical protein